MASTELDMREIEDRLNEERTKLTAELPSAGEVAEMFPRGDVLDPEDMSVQQSEREVNLDIADRRGARVENIDEALARIGAGSYGTCLECSEPIGVARLQADPAVPLCLHCQQLLEDREQLRTPAL